MRYLVLVLLLAACGDASGPPGPAAVDVSGEWSGDLPDGVLRLTLTHDTTRNAVSGTGAFDFENRSVPLTAGGTYSAPSIVLAITVDGYPVSVLGTHSDTEIDATVNGYGYVHRPVTLTRQ